MTNAATPNHSNAGGARPPTAKDPPSFGLSLFLSTPTEPLDQLALSRSTKSSPKTAKTRVKKTKKYLKEWDEDWKKACSGSGVK